MEEALLAKIPGEKAKIAVDTGIVENDSKGRHAVGEVTPDYQDVLFVKGFGGIVKEYLNNLSDTFVDALNQRDFYQSVILISMGIIIYANRYGETAEKETGVVRK